MNIFLAIGIGFAFWALCGFFSTRGKLEDEDLPPALKPLAQTRGNALLVILLAVSLSAGSAAFVNSWVQRMMPLPVMLPVLLLIAIGGYVSGCCLAILLQAIPGRG